MASSRQSTGSLKAKVRQGINKVRDQRRVSMDVPERFQIEDNEEDVTAVNEDNQGYAQQSLYGMIGATHSRSGLQLQGHFQPDSGSESGGETETEGSGRNSKVPSTAASQASSNRSSVDEQRQSPKPEASRHRKNKSEGKGLRSFLRPIRERSDSQPPEFMTHSGFLPAREKATEEPERPASAGGIRSDAPMLDRKLHARARAEMDASTTSTTSRRSKEGSSSEGAKKRASAVDLPAAVAGIFGFREPEDIICEYPCWYLQSVLLQGYLYITKKHVCFYAYMQKKGHATIKSGQLAKQGKRNPRYRRYWFALKGDVLSYYTNAADPYFPSGTVDLRYGISADLVPEKGQDKPKDTCLFTVTTDNRTYHFRADSATSAKEWVKQLQKVIFRSHNDGDSIKISLPLENVVDVESSPLNDMAETIRLRVIDNDQTYSVDEYFFTFFSHGKDALHLLNVLTADNEIRKAPQGKRGLSYLGSSPKDYYTKFSGAMAGGKRHYSEADGLAPEDRIEDPEDDLDTVEHERRFQQHFALPESERLLAVYYGSLHRVLPLYGKVYIGTRNFCFRSLLYGTRTKLVVPFKNILNLEKEKGFRWGYPGMVVVIRGHEELFFDFSSNGLRDDCVVTVLRTLDAVRALQESVILTVDEKKDADAAAAENSLLSGARKDVLADRDAELSETLGQIESDTPIIFDDPNASILDFKPTKAMRITCLTIGSRGDIQPYIALCKGLLADGQRPRIATHQEFKGWVEKHGIEFAPVEGDPAELMRVCVENGMFTPQFLYKATSQFRQWFDNLLTSAYDACKGSDLVIESPSAMAGIHIAEALGIPYFRAFTMPWTRTRAYPHAFAVPSRKQGGAYNYMSYAFFDNLFWQISASQINKWRCKHLGLKPTSLEKLQPNKVPFLYNFSPSVVVPPLDFSDWVRVTGYWFLDEGTAWPPPDDLMAFINRARADKQKLVYIGFGSVTVSDSKQLTQQVVDAVLKADVRCILSKGWSDHFDKKDASVPEVPLPPSVFQIRSAPHDWLFQQIDAAVHHGGAGTTGASLRAGVPTIIKPFFGDQYFFATRVEDLGVGIHLRKITVNSLGKALWIATHDDRMRGRARVLGEQIRNEDGVATAIKAIYRDLDYAKTLIKKREVKIDGGGEVEDTEEAWTFVENDSDGDVARLGEPEVSWSSSTQGLRGWDGGGGVGGRGKRTSLGSMVLKAGQKAR
ncbi:hypothetical protein B0A55_08625 [Friedmanniomyces simplex]|uniref:Sterol 3-beta-glucosyltransferase n=1 Tax=Friedmanniomyces simplex TaxID=329884 RepID=A0A4U0WU54_9PEZI|nr:hypothetical protein B0A55_08625 [Friedmanniomyces simplex]